MTTKKLNKSVLRDRINELELEMIYIKNILITDGNYDSSRNIAIFGINENGNSTKTVKKIFNHLQIHIPDEEYCKKVLSNNHMRKTCSHNFYLNCLRVKVLAHKKY